jgi:hypothetical protein
MSIKNPHDSISNRTCDLQACSALLEPTVPPRNAAGHHLSNLYSYLLFECFTCHVENNLIALLLFSKPGVFNLSAACGLPSYRINLLPHLLIMLIL